MRMGIKKYIKLQHDQRDCGAACLATIAAFYDLRYPFSYFRELTKTDKSGTNLYGLVEGGKKLGFACKALYGNPEDLMQNIEQKQIQFPFIAHTVNKDNFFHYVVVFSINEKEVILGDPSCGKCKLTINNFLKSWTGYIVTFAKTNSFRPGNHTGNGFCQFFSLLHGQYKNIAGILVISLIISIVGILGAFIFEIVIDNFVNVDGNSAIISENFILGNTLESIVKQISKSIPNVHFIFFAIIILYLFQSLIQFVRGYLIISLSQTIDLRLSLAYYRHIIGLPVTAISQHQTGEYLSRFSDASSIREAVSGATLTLILDSLMVVACGIILYLKNRKMFVVALSMVIFYAIVVLSYRKPVEQSNRVVMERNAEVQSYLKESIDGVETVKAACADKQVKEIGSSKFQIFIKAIVKNSLITVSQDTIVDTIEMIGTVIILWTGFALVLSNQMTIGSLMTFYALLSYFTEPIKNLIGLQPAIQTALVAADRLNDILDLHEETVNSKEQYDMPNVTLWSFEHVDFRYGNKELILKNISLQIKQGERIAIVGESGSGKTTLAKLFIRFYNPEKGHIMLNDKDIAEIALIALRRSVAYVSQDTFMFSDTIRNNLKLGNPDITDEDMHHACKICQADEFIERLPMGYNTPLDEGGRDLSSGQRQRLALARALLKKPQLLILDEATSNLDSITESAIKNIIFQLDSSLTCIIIAHRLSTVKKCDRIYVMEQGEIVEYGSHDELISLGKKYAKLCEKQ